MKRSYHTDITIQYKLGILDTNLVKQIPSSTLHNWKNKDLSLLFGSEHVSDSEQNLQMIKDFLTRKSLLQIAKAVYYVYCSYVKLFDQVKNKRKILHQSKDLVIKTIDQIKDTVSFNRAVNAFGISCQQYYAWKKKVQCKILPPSLCRKVYHNQLTTKEVGLIKKYLKNPQYRHWSVTSVFYQILRDRAAFFSKTTFYKYVNLFQLQRSRPEKKKYDTGIRAEAPKKILHMDVTIYRPVNHSRVYLYFLVDNYSRFILNWKASLEYSAKITFQNISEAYEKYKLKNINPHVDLICDGGSENKGPVDVFVDNYDSNIQKLVAQTDIRFSNSMVEAVNKRIKYDFLFNTKLEDIYQTVKYLNCAVSQYNNKPHSSLYGLTPTEVFNGTLPNKDMYKPALLQAAKKRKEINLSCRDCNELNPV
ncbi:MAG: DDE-type integrase/transposase/recombinase [Bacteroidales bacterium]|jgi:hypothetical protein